MAYDTNDLYNQALEIIRTREVLTIEGIVALMPCTKTTFYDHFSVDSNELNEIKRSLNMKKVEAKEKLIKIMRSPLGSPAERIFLYKLLADREEKEAIYDTSIRAAVEAPKHNITLNLKKSDENIIDVEMDKPKEEPKND